MDTMINQLVHLPGGFKGDIFREKMQLMEKNTYKKIRETHTNGHAQKIRIVKVIRKNM